VTFYSIDTGSYPTVACLPSPNFHWIFLLHERCCHLCPTVPPPAAANRQEQRSAQYHTGFSLYTAIFTRKPLSKTVYPTVSCPCSCLLSTVLTFYTKGIGSYSTVPPTRVPPLCEYPARKIYPKKLVRLWPAVYSRTDRWIPLHGPLDLRIPDHRIPKHKNLWISQKRTAGSPKMHHWIPKLLTTGPEKKTDRWIHNYRPLDLKKRTAGSTKPAEQISTMVLRNN